MIFVSVSAALCGVVMYNYLKVKDVRATQLPVDAIAERATKVHNSKLRMCLDDWFFVRFDFFCIFFMVLCVLVLF